MPPSSPTALTALAAVPAGVVAVLAHKASYVFVLVLVGVVLAAVPALADTWMRWKAQRMWLELERRRLQALDRMDAPERVLERLPPLSVGPLGRPVPAEGPAPPIAPRDDPTAAEQGEAG